MDWQVRTVANLAKLGREPEEIAERLCKPLGWVQEVLLDNTVSEYLKRAKVTEEDDVEIWSGDAKRYHQERLVPMCFRTWEGILSSKDSSDSSKLKAAESIMKYDVTLKETAKDKEEHATYISFSDEALQRLTRLSAADKAMLDKAYNPEDHIEEYTGD